MRHANPLRGLGQHHETPRPPREIGEITSTALQGGKFRQRKMAAMSASSFIFDGGRPCLDFVNTLRKRKDPFTESVDALQEHGMHEWLAAARRHTSWATGLPHWNGRPATAGPPPHHGPQELREAIYELFTDELAALHPATGSPRDDASKEERMLSNIAIVNAYAVVTVRYTLTASAAGRLEIDNTLTETELLGRIANDAIGLLGGRDLIRVKECAHDRCGVLFEDRSNGLKRQWCSMRKCGNVSKAERFSKR